jgi:hypothetical protein
LGLKSASYLLVPSVIRSVIIAEERVPKVIPFPRNPVATKTLPLLDGSTPMEGSPSAGSKYWLDQAYSTLSTSNCCLQ